VKIIDEEHRYYIKYILWGLMGARVEGGVAPSTQKSDFK
jgi:hypothetical protein